jgi:hypothetical protein
MINGLLELEARYGHFFRGNLKRLLKMDHSELSRCLDVFAMRVYQDVHEWPWKALGVSRMGFGDLRKSEMLLLEQCLDSLEVWEPSPKRNDIAADLFGRYGHKILAVIDGDSSEDKEREA